MSSEHGNQTPQVPDQQALYLGNLSELFFDGLPSMTMIVTLIAQPFAQMRDNFNLPPWLPIAVALAVSGLLAVYKLRIVRRSTVPECAICTPLLMLVIFAAYTAGNNAVYYAKEGYSRPASTSQLSSEELRLRDHERELLQTQLASASKLIDTLYGALNIPGPREDKPRSSLLVPLAFLGRLATGTAYAEEPRPPAADARRRDAVTSQQLKEALKKYEAQRNEVEEQLKKVREEREKIRTSPPPLIKSW